jgi:hypothetical protein
MTEADQIKLYRYCHAAARKLMHGWPLTLSPEDVAGDAFMLAMGKRWPERVTSTYMMQQARFCVLECRREATGRAGKLVGKQKSEEGYKWRMFAGGDSLDFVAGLQRPVPDAVSFRDCVGLWVSECLSEAYAAGKGPRTKQIRRDVMLKMLWRIVRDEEIKAGLNTRVGWDNSRIMLRVWKRLTKEQR